MFINVNAGRVQVCSLYFFLAMLLNVFCYTQNINYNREDQGVLFQFSDNPWFKFIELIHEKKKSLYLKGLKKAVEVTMLYW